MGAAVVALAAVLAGCGHGAGHASSAASPARYWTGARMRGARPHLSPGIGRTARPTSGNAKVGALFYDDGGTDHFCTASVVDSPHKSIIITAAHCVYSHGAAKTNMVFVPAYRDGTAPYGTWTVRHVVVDQHWQDGADPDFDVAFMDLEPLNGKRIGDVLGGNAFGWNEGFGRFVKITGYPASEDAPISCRNKTQRYSSTQMRIDCTGYSGGTSGSPWLAGFSPATGTGTVIGVIGGYLEGGDNPDTSYSVYFDKDIKALYDRAVAEEN